MTEQAYKNIYRIYVPLTGNPLKSLNSYLIKAEGTGKEPVYRHRFQLRRVP